MLSPQTLTRGEPVGEKTDGLFDRPFANFDYSEGHKAGANDRHWADKRGEQVSA